jgi:hypothetical protein
LHPTQSREQRGSSFDHLGDGQSKQKLDTDHLTSHGAVGRGNELQNN